MKKILLVDDDKTLQAVLTRYLEKRGYSVDVVTSGVQGLKLFTQQDPPDLVVSDIMMPGMDGLEFCRRLRATRPGELVPFIFLTAKKDLEDRIQGHIIGADDYITKPFEPLELLAKIQSQLQRTDRINSAIIAMIRNVPNGIEIGTENDKNIPEASLTPPAKIKPEGDLPLTPAEIRVFWEVIQGLTNKQISQRLFISPRTVQTHLSNILTKLNLENRSQLVRFAFEHGYRPPQTQDEEKAAEARS
ncbi:response regulator transcription factor [Chamaesiphon sp. VAR_48_metabat_135_sub]|uniref:response regulator transcription factor n=1 Tax=Chamaesiphon sp. VAR_48_metabat_135_sub TaxID=2964699 RepID=UPI00286AE708|nr:response regulator transcription factor [Chamaesiphon sp. VAR_48_metabat_135_sub]